ncbi:GAF domain-containing protein [Alicyclobacillus mengziensis]|uniref:GAF domain-containing protein n=1 Tax=Alicyclobacillus mengziensis TaxID=2931921 RepID=A0A9X7Z943_9BACL|nr:GAF domain-containing protein [Alicyclobacillus mengziensis]QSO49145.1 GAF domain-containing protein [Alicyclobacillus mengziensis]
MYEHTTITSETRSTFYQQLAEQAFHLVSDEPNAIANLSNVSALLNLHLDNINWVGFYLFEAENNELVLGPFQGKPACIRIALGKGVCGTAMASGESIVVEDVFQFPGHIACDADSRSEVVIPMVRDGVKLGVLDIDAPMPGRFDEEDARGLEQIVKVIVEHANL